MGVETTQVPVDDGYADITSCTNRNRDLVGKYPDWASCRLLSASATPQPVQRIMDESGEDYLYPADLFIYPRKSLASIRRSP